MRNIFAVYLKEVKSYFSSHTIYVISAVFILVIGNAFKTEFIRFSSESMQLMRLAWESGSEGLNLININAVSHLVFNYINFFLLLIVPLLTMRLFSEEKKNGTMELLMTSPITTFQVIMGKFLSCLTIYTLMLILTAGFMVMLYVFSQGQLDVMPIVSSYGGSILLGMAIIPIGMFFSSTTENQITSAFISMFILLSLWMLMHSAQFFRYPISEIIAFVSLSDHLDSFKRGFIGVRHIFYYISMSVFWMFLSWMNVESARWRQ